MEKEKRVYRFISGPSHGWVEVPERDINAWIDSGGEITPYSYVDHNGGLYYLEEDCDANAYLGYLKSINTEFILNENLIDDEREIRSLPSVHMGV